MILFDTVTKTYAKATRPALSEVSLEVERGEFVFIVGSPGAGKPTLLRLAIREERVTSGSVLVAGRELRTLPDRRVPLLRREIGTVFQDFRLLPNKTVFQNVAFALQVIGRSRALIRQTVPETLRVVGLEGKEKRLPHQLSGGEQQRVAIARAIVNKPTILLADEPTGNLDPATSREILLLLERFNRAGTTGVMARHDHEQSSDASNVSVTSTPWVGSGLALKATKRTPPHAWPGSGNTQGLAASRTALTADDPVELRPSTPFEGTTRGFRSLPVAKGRSPVSDVMSG